MELRQLEAFVAVAEEQNFTRAALRLYVAQSGLSATIRSLERELQATLFARTTRRVELTAAGEALLAEARRTLSSARAAAEAVDAVESLRRGTLGIELKLPHASSVELGRLVGEHVTDVVFRSASAEASPRLVSIPLARSPLVVCSPEDVPADNAVVDLRDLGEAALVGSPSGWGIRTLSDLAFRSRGIEPRSAFEVNDTQTVLDLVEFGLGVALLPDVIAAMRDARLRRIPIRGRRWNWTISAQALAPGPSTPAARALWTMLIERERGSRTPPPGRTGPD
jgi:DNA-binding transcriptional LysR family regulator